MKSWVRFSLQHPVPTIVFFLVAMVMGFVSLTRLSIDLLPAMEIPLAVVSTRYEGAGPQEVESLVSRPLEDIMGTVAGVTKVRSSNSEGQSLVIVEFDYGTNMDLATLAMREKVDQVKGFFPDGVESSNVFKIDPQAMPVLTVGLTGEEDLVALKRLAEDVIKPRLERVDGVASVTINGGTEREIQVIVDPGRLQAAGLSINQVAQALAYENLNLPGGEVSEGNVNLLVRTMGQFQSVDEIRNLRLGVVRLGDVAEVLDTYADITSKVWLDGDTAVSLDIQKQSGGNAVAVANAVKDELKLIEKELPGAVNATVLSDQSRMVLSSINSVSSSGLQGGLLAILVLLLFLRHFRATLAVALAIPISVITTFGPLFFGGVTLNILSLGGLSMGVGMMVDGAIVVLENIFRHKEMGKDTYTAALDGTSEVALAVTASTMTSVVVFLPVVWITGLAQIYFRELALSVTFSLLVSVMTSLTVVPILASWLLRDRTGPAKPPSKLYLKIGERLDQLDSLYSRILNWALRRKWTVIGIGVSSLALAGLLVTQMGMEFIPSSDTGEFRVSIKMPPGTRLEETEKTVNLALEQIQGVPELRQFFVNVGGSGNAYVSSSGRSNQAYIVATIAPLGERNRGLSDVMEDARSRLVLPGAQVSVTSSGMIDTGGAPIEVQISGSDLDVLEELSAQVMAEVARVPGARELDSSVSEGLPEVQIKVDRARAATYGLSPSQVAQSVQAAVRGQVVTQYRVGGEEFDIRLQANEETRKDVIALGQLPVATPMGQTVPLNELANVVRAVGPTTVEREDQSRVVRVTGQLYNRDLGSVMSDIKARMAKLNLPPGYSIAYGGQNQMMEDAFGGLSLALAFSIVLVYLVMVAQFESFLHPFVILFTIPLSMVGAIGALVVSGRNLDIAGMIGVILLVGLVVNNAIVLIDYTNQLRRDGMDRDTAVRTAGPIRLRPVLMTTLTTLLGLLPLALGLSEGADMQAPMATVVIGGLALSTLLTLVVIPVTYTLMDDAVNWVTRKVFKSPAATM